MDLKQHIRQIPDFPKPGINFFDISTLLRHPAAWRDAIERLTALVAPWRPDAIAAIDARGFLVGAPLALQLGCGLVMVRKRGKLPGNVRRASYGLEYGTDSVEIQHDAIASGQRVAIVDDLLATGGTIMAAAKLLRGQGAGVAGAACLIELAFLNGRGRLDMPVASLVSYDSE
ncbi:MAG: adenine phosphoribosyltransferase [Rhodospirillaceae bacterium]|nr:adenine phosphoribosyltransferase [Rhodospirillaceae bacterium]